MAHNYNDNGTVYEIGGGKVNMNGTVYDSDHGKVNDNGTVYEIAFGAKLITFTLQDLSEYEFQAEDGMTWQEFVNSDYNNQNTFHIGNYVTYTPWSAVVLYDGINISGIVKSTDLIIDGYEYALG